MPFVNSKLESAGPHSPRTTAPPVRSPVLDRFWPRPRAKTDERHYLPSRARWLSRSPRRGGRAAECTGLENRRAKAHVGSNPTPSASWHGICRYLIIICKTCYIVASHAAPLLANGNRWDGNDRGKNSATRHRIGHGVGVARRLWSEYESKWSSRTNDRNREVEVMPSLPCCHPRICDSEVGECSENLRGGGGGPPPEIPPRAAGLRSPAGLR